MFCTINREKLREGFRCGLGKIVSLLKFPGVSLLCPIHSKYHESVALAVLDGGEICRVWDCDGGEFRMVVQNYLKK